MSNTDPLAALSELRRREEELMRMNQELDKRNQEVLRGVMSHPKMTDSDLAGVPDDDVDFKDFDDEEGETGLKIDYSQVDPYDKSTLRNSELKTKKTNKGIKEHSNNIDNNPYTAKLRQLEQNDELVDSFHIEPRRDDTMEERGRRLLTEAGHATKADLLRKAEQVTGLTEQLAEQKAANTGLQHEVERLASKLTQVMTDLATREDQLRRLENKALLTSAEADRLSKELKATNEKFDAAKLQLMDAKRQMGGIAKEKQGAERENNMMNKTQKKFEGDLAKKEQR